MNRKSSWRTTLGGCVTSAGAALIAGAAANPAWMYEWERHTCFALGFAFSIVGPFVHGLFTRDVNVTSEEAGAFKETEPKSL